MNMPDDSRLVRVFPFLGWSGIGGATLRADLAAGITVAMVLIPQSLAYAQLAGMPAHYGLYAAFLPVMIAGLWGSCRQLSTGPVALTSILTAAVLAPLAVPGSESYVRYAVVLGLMVGLLRLVFGLFRLGFVVNFISHPVVRGFTNAAALLIALSQCGRLLGLPTYRHDFPVMVVVDIARNLGDTNFQTLAIGFAAVGLIAGVERKWQRIPAALIAALVTSVFVFIADWRVELVGRIPEGLPRVALQFVPWSEVPHLLTGALIVMMVGFLEVFSISRAIAVRTRQRIDFNRELVAQGLASIGGWLTQSFPVSGSFSRSALNLSAGARSGMASVFAGLVVLVTLLFLTPLLYYLPQAALAAIILTTVVKLINFREFAEHWRAHPHDGIAAGVTFAVTLFTDPVWGVLAGASLAIMLYLYRTMEPRVAVLGKHPDGTYRDARLHGLAVDEELPAIRFDGRLYFANVSHFETAVLNVASDHPAARHIIIVGDGINELDASGEWMLRGLVCKLREGGVTLVFVGLKYQVTEVMKRTGLDELIGEENFFRTEDGAYEALRVRVADAKTTARDQ